MSYPTVLHALKSVQFKDSPFVLIKLIWATVTRNTAFCLPAAATFIIQYLNFDLMSALSQNLTAIRDPVRKAPSP